MAKKGLIIVGLLASLAAAGYGAWQFYFKDKLMKRTDDSIVAYVTQVGRITPENLGNQNWYTGVVEAEKTRNVSIDTGRSVSEVKVSVGDFVHVGDLLFEYDLATTETSLRQARLEYNKLVDSGKTMADEISGLEKSYWEAQNAAEQLTISLDLESRRMDQKKNEYQVTSKLTEIEKLEAAMQNTQVLCDMDGVVQKIDTSKLTSEDGDTLTSSVNILSSDSDDSSENDFITILSTGDYKVKGLVNEQNRKEIVPGERVQVRSRARQNLVWYGTVGNLDEQGGKTTNEDSYFGDSSNSQTNTTIYPFSVTLDSSDGLNLGEHVYIELDRGRSERADGLWLLEYYILDADTQMPYVWAADETDHLEKRMVTLGEYDSLNGEYQILEGLTKDDYIAFPDESFLEGIRAVDSSVHEVETDEQDPIVQSSGEPQDSWQIDESPEGSAQIDETPDGAVQIDESPEGSAQIDETPDGAVQIDETPEGSGQIVDEEADFFDDSDGELGMISDEDELAFEEEYEQFEEELEEGPEEITEEEESEESEEDQGSRVVYDSDDVKNAG